MDDQTAALQTTSSIQLLKELPTRLRHRLEVKIDERRAEPGDYVSENDAEQLHRLLDVPWPCAETERFEAEWSRMLIEATDGPLGGGHDADIALARAEWCVVRHLRPERVVETGVARGVSTRFLLAALELNGSGRLWSIDLPPLRRPWRDQVAVFVPLGLRGNWTYIRGSSRKMLPRLLKELGTIDMFVHDSLHTFSNMAFEFDHSWRALRAGGVLLSDDVGLNRAFERFGASLPDDSVLVLREKEKNDYLGMARKQDA